MNIPNTFQVFNVYIDRAMELLTDAEFRCLMFATRHILGWRDKVNDRQGVISLTMFERGFETKAGAHFGGCGLSRGTIIEATNKLVEFGFLERIGQANMYGQRWQLSDGEIKWAKLEERKAARDAINQKRTVKATRASVKKREAGTSDVTSNVERTSAGTSDVTDAGTSDVLNQTHANTSINIPLAPADADAVRATPVEVDSAIYGPAEKPERKRDEVFDAVASLVFGIHNPDALNGQGGRVAVISNWLRGKQPTKNAQMRGVGQLERPATAEELQKFCRWYQGKYRGVSIPKDVGKFAEHFLAYRESTIPTKVIGGALDMSDIAPDDPNFYKIQTERMQALWEAQNERRSA